MRWLALWPWAGPRRAERGERPLAGAGCVRCQPPAIPRRSEPGLGAMAFPPSRTGGGCPGRSWPLGVRHNPLRPSPTAPRAAVSERRRRHQPAQPSRQPNRQQRSHQPGSGRRRGGRRRPRRPRPAVELGSKAGSGAGRRARLAFSGRSQLTSTPLGTSRRNHAAPGAGRRDAGRRPRSAPRFPGRRGDPGRHHRADRAPPDLPHRGTKQGRRPAPRPPTASPASPTPPSLPRPRLAVVSWGGEPRSEKAKLWHAGGRGTAEFWPLSDQIANLPPFRPMPD